MKVSTPNLLCFSILLLTFYHAGAQSNTPFDPLNPPDTYRNADNPYYWKNKLPFAGYWQQDVHYDINASVSEKTDIITGSEKLTYYNNSPDTLSFVYFHLYQNAFQPGSYLDNLEKNNHAKPKYGKYESQGLGTTVSKMQQNGKDLKMELDNTVVKVYLSRPILPNSSTVFNVDFKTYFDGGGSVRRRMRVYNAWGFKHYNGVHWYPRICAYDRKMGWDTDQHLNREFYGDFGSYDVALTMANNMVVEATGNLLNRAEVLPDDLREKLDLKNFVTKPMNGKPSIVIPYDSTIRKTWKYHAENVHDFAFTADPTYRLSETYAFLPGDKRLPKGLEQSGIKAIAIVQEPHAAGWWNAADFTAKVVQTYSQDFGMFVYPKIVVADAQDGMEYPMITLDGGTDPGYQSTLAHEVGHNWFFGMLGNNETYRAMMDEGFTQFLTSWSMEKIDGPIDPRNRYKSKYAERFSEPTLTRDLRVYIGYLSDAISESDERINQHSDAFNGALGQGGGYRHVYMKTATMLYDLQYVLGDSLFRQAMHHYTEQWKMAHPYPEDFRNSIIQYTHVDLNWFFDEWIESTKNVDYAVGRVKKGPNKDEYVIHFKRKGRMEMPIDFTVIGKDKKEYNYSVPNRWFQKKTDATTLPKWFGWDKLDPTYEAHVTIPGGIKNVIIDPTHRLADVNMLNNSWKCPTIWKFDSQVSNFPDWKHYRMFWRPDIWYNSYDGVKVGMHIDGNYLNFRHKVSLTAWYNTGLGQGGYENLDYDSVGKKKFLAVSFNFTYSHSIDKLINNGFFDLALESLDGLQAGQLGIESKLGKTNDLVSVYVKSMIRARDADLAYLIYPQEWIAKKFNNSINVEYSHSYAKAKMNGNIKVQLRSSALMSDFNYNYIRLTALHNFTLKKFDLHTRVFGQFGTGSNWARESSLFAAGANPEELMDSKYTRSVGILPQQWGGYGSTVNHFQEGGGLNLRGYAGYYLVEDDGSSAAYRGTCGWAVNGELDFERLLNIKSKLLNPEFHLATYLFGDAGMIVYENFNGAEKISSLRADAGIGAALTIKKFSVLQKVRSLTIRFDMPLFLNEVPFAESNGEAKYMKFRWVVGINRAF